MKRAELIERAARAYALAGRGVVVKLMEDVEPRYVPIDEIRASLIEEKADPGILFGVIYATGKYEPRWQAVYLLEQ